MRQVFLAIEDSRFYEHPGIDLIGIAKAGVVWAVSGQMRQGASTITQQVARNFSWVEKHCYEKLEVFGMANRTEPGQKDEILSFIFNKIPLEISFIWRWCCYRFTMVNGGSLDIGETADCRVT